MARKDRQLERVLEQRANVELKHQRIVADFELQRVGLEDRIRAMQSSLQIIRQDLREVLSPNEVTRAPIDASNVRLQAGASLHAQLHTQSLAIELAGVLKRMEAAREKLMAAAAQRKAVELLLTRRREEAQRAEERREAAELDEISTIRHARADHDRVETLS